MRTVLVTGGSQGIGQAIALGLATDGAEVVGIQYLSNLDAANQTRTMIEKIGAKCIVLQADFTKNTVATVKNLADEFLYFTQKFSGEHAVDILVNNVGLGGSQMLGHITEEIYYQVINANLTAPLFLIQALYPYIREGGRIINISTGFTHKATPTYPVYSAAKAGINTLTQTLAPQLAKQKITINAVMPGYVETSRNALKLKENTIREVWSAQSVFNRIGNVEDIVPAVRYLASEGSRWTTGQVIDVTGGSLL